MERISCIFCHKSSSTVAIQENGYQGNRCPQCALIYISPRPAHDEIVNLYGHDNAQIAAQTYISGGLLKRLYARPSLNIIKKYCKSGKILEIGAGAGYFLDEARKGGFDPHAIELNPVEAHFIEQYLNIPCEKRELSARSFGDKIFDIIYHCDVISHFHDPISAFKAMHTKLQDDGLLVFETGNIAEVKQKYLPAFTSFQYPDNLFFFSEDNIERLLTLTGFELLATYRFNILPQLKLLKWMRRGKKHAEAVQSPFEGTGKLQVEDKRLKSIFKKTYYYCMYFMRYHLGAWLPKKGHPQTIIVIARKKR